MDLGDLKLIAFSANAENILKALQSEDVQNLGQKFLFSATIPSDGNFDEWISELDSLAITWTMVCNTSTNYLVCLHSDIPVSHPMHRHIEHLSLNMKALREELEKDRGNHS